MSDVEPITADELEAVVKDGRFAATEKAALRAVARIRELERRVLPEGWEPEAAWNDETMTRVFRHHTTGVWMQNDGNDEWPVAEGTRDQPHSLLQAIRAAEAAALAGEEEVQQGASIPEGAVLGPCHDCATQGDKTRKPTWPCSRCGNMVCEPHWRLLDDCLCWTCQGEPREAPSEPAQAATV